MNESLLSGTEARLKGYIYIYVCIYNWSIAFKIIATYSYIYFYFWLLHSVNVHLGCFCVLAIVNHQKATSAYGILEKAKWWTENRSDVRGKRERRGKGTQENWRGAFFCFNYNDGCKTLLKLIEMRTKTVNFTVCRFYLNKPALENNGKKKGTNTIAFSI